MKNDKNRRLFWNIAAILAFFAAGLCACFIWRNLVGKQEAAIRYQELREERVTEGKQEETDSPEEAKTEKAENRNLDIPADFKRLRNENPDIYAWICVPGTEIDYPVVQSRMDDSFYITHGIDRTESIAGAIFSEGLNKLDFSDAHTVLYGHNMRDGSMFAGLHKFEDNGFFEKHREIKMYTEDAVRTYKIFAAYRYDDRHLLKSYDCSAQEAYRSYLEEIKKQRGLEANIDTGVEVTTDDRILTLSTCDKTGNGGRYLVQAVLEGELLEDGAEK